MAMTCSLTQTLVLPRFHSALPKLNNLVQGLRAQRAVEFLADFEDGNNFQAREDWILCSCIPHYREPCMAYYAGTGPQLRDMVSKRVLKSIDQVLCNALEVAMLMKDEGIQSTWSEISRHQ